VIAAERKQKIEAMQQQVDESKALANRSLEQRSCLSEYESLAKVINENYPTSSTELQKEIDQIREEISNLEEASAKKDEIIKVREAQYQLLIQYMMDLKHSLEDDNEELTDQGGRGEKQGNDNGNKPQPMEIDNLYGDL
jgi:septal ring factor EnvC (AmiA/AmiB activator)